MSVPPGSKLALATVVDLTGLVTVLQPSQNRPLTKPPEVPPEGSYRHLGDLEVRLPTVDWEPVHTYAQGHPVGCGSVL